MKILQSGLILSLCILLSTSCKKDEKTTNPDPSLTSLASFHQINGAQLVTYSINAATGGSFTTAKGTSVYIPENAFITAGGGAVTGTVSIDFKDIYSKEDMVLSDVSTEFYTGVPMKSGGMFYIKARQGSVALQSTKTIMVGQPLNGAGWDAGMKPMRRIIDTANRPVWINTGDSLAGSATGYVFLMYQFSYPIDSGTWCNSDNATFFPGQLTSLDLNATDNYSDYKQEVFLIFHDANAMIHVYNFWVNTFSYHYAPLGASCTLVSVAVKNEKIYSCFKPITITENLSVDFTLTETTLEAFKTQLKAVQ